MRLLMSAWTVAAFSVAPSMRPSGCLSPFASTPIGTHMAHRFLGEGNEFVLGATGRPSLAMLADYALKTLDLWFWFAAFVAFAYREVLFRADPELLKTYHDTAEAAKPVAAWLREQFNRVLAEEQAEMRSRLGD